MSPSSSRSAGRSGAARPRFQSATTSAERKNGDGQFIVPFVETLCSVTKDTFAGPAGEPLVLRPWQKTLINGLFARVQTGPRKGKLRHRQALIGMPRKNGKTALGAAIGLYGLFFGPTGAEVYSCAGEREQARICFGMARQMIEAEPELAGEAKLYRDVIEVPSRNAIYRVLSAEAYSKEGLSPTLVIFDELHVQPNDELWNVMTLGSAARVDPLVLGITTAGVRTDTLGRDSLCYRMYQYGQQVARGEVDDPSFFFAWWEPKLGAEAIHTNPKVWQEANPGYDDLVDPEDFQSVVLRTPESEFRTKRTNVFVTSSDPALPFGAWDRCADPTVQVGMAPCVLFVDGSWSGDSTAIVGSTTTGHLFQVGLWERPPDDETWRVPIGDVKQAIRDAASALNCPMIAFDPYRWQATMQELLEEGLPVVEFPTGSVARMVPAWKTFYDAVCDKVLTHDGNPALARHIENMQLKFDHSGARPVKEHKGSQRHIDLGICAVGAYHLAMMLELVPNVADNVW